MRGCSLLTSLENTDYNHHHKDLVPSFHKLAVEEKPLKKVRKFLGQKYQSIMRSDDVFDKIEKNEGAQTYFFIKNELKKKAQKKTPKNDDENKYLLNTKNYQSLIDYEKYKHLPDSEFMYTLLNLLDLREKEKAKKKEE
ncbi:MAG: hypothetical protein MJ252_15910, partial [archaeon]|nr:hypothetical protein [archaeon]